MVREHIEMIMGSLLSWNVSVKLSVGSLAPPSCKDSFFFSKHFPVKEANLI